MASSTSDRDTKSKADLDRSPGDGSGRSDQTHAKTVGERTDLRAEDPTNATGRRALVIEATDVDGTTLRVKPAVFLSLLGRTSAPLVAHARRRLGPHHYLLHFGGFTVETESHRALPLPEDNRAISQPEPTLPTIQEERSAGGGLSLVWERNEGSGESGQTLREYSTKSGFNVSEWWNTDDDPALSVARLRIKAGVATRSYRLRVITERYLFLTGNGLLELDGVTHKVGPGTNVLIRPGTWRAVKNVGDRDLGLLSICQPRYRRHGYDSSD